MIYTQDPGGTSSARGADSASFGELSADSHELLPHGQEPPILPERFVPTQHHRRPPKQNTRIPRTKRKNSVRSHSAQKWTKPPTTKLMHHSAAPSFNNRLLIHRLEGMGVLICLTQELKMSQWNTHVSEVAKTLQHFCKYH